MASTVTENVFKIIFALLLRIGMILIHVGCIPATNVNNIYIHHLLNMAYISTIYLLFGHLLALGATWSEVFGPQTFLGWEDKDNLVTTWQAVLYASGIVQLVTAGRSHIVGDIISNCIFSGILHPLLIHYTWTERGWLRAEFGFEDMAGGTVIHMYSGTIALGAMIIFGRRIINLKDLDHNSIAINSQTTTVLGYSFVIIGTIMTMVYPPFQKGLDANFNLITCLTVLFASITVMAIIYCAFSRKFHYWFIVWMLQGGLAGLVTVSAGVGRYYPLISLAYTIIGSITYTVFSAVVRTTGFEDYCNIMSVHLLPGAIATYLATFNDKAISSSIGRVSYKLLWQGVSSLTIFIIAMVTSLTVYTLLGLCNILRNEYEQNIHEDTMSWGHWCCPVFRTLDTSTSNIIKPGFHTLQRLKNRKLQRPKSFSSFMTDQDINAVEEIVEDEQPFKEEA